MTLPGSALASDTGFARPPPDVTALPHQSREDKITAHPPAHPFPSLGREEGGSMRCGAGDGQGP